VLDSSGVTIYLLCQCGWYTQISNGNIERVIPKVHFPLSPIDAKIPEETENILKIPG
jgi:hypothetical protein